MGVLIFGSDRVLLENAQESLAQIAQVLTQKPSAETVAQISSEANRALLENAQKNFIELAETLTQTSKPDQLATFSHESNQLLLKEMQSSLANITTAITLSSKPSEEELTSYKNNQMLLENLQESLTNISAFLSQKLETEKIDLYSDTEIKNAAYALNLCTVSVSQIVEYNDIGILEQEYEAILNNLNIEHMPKDEALLNIIKELLNVITYFRIQEKKKDMLEREYQHNIKNAIWSAVPNASVIMGGSPLAVAVSLASQVGTGYMNYRKTKASLILAKEKNEWQLQQSAMEQLNGLRRELFETAWRLADTYQFPDEYRLTERQITQYNQILLDVDPLRRYERLLYVENNFKAYPPFHYYIGHAANEVSNSFSNTPEIQDSYRNKAQAHFKQLLDLTGQNILREDQILAACALEYFELRLTAGDADREYLCDLLHRASRSAGNANDVLQLCAMSYMRIGMWDEATNLMRMLVNEGHNQIINAQFLSTYYVSSYLKSFDSQAKEQYNTLSQRVPMRYLAPMPEVFPEEGTYQDKGQLDSLMKTFLFTQKVLLFQKYVSVVAALADQYTVAYNKELYLDLFTENQANFCYTDSREGINAQQKAVDKYWSNTQPDFAADNDPDKVEKLLKVLNDCYIKMCSIVKDDVSAQEELYTAILTKMNSEACSLNKLLSQKIKKNDFKRLSFDCLMEDSFRELIRCISTTIKNYENMGDISASEIELVDYCIKCNLPLPQENYDTNSSAHTIVPDSITLASLGADAIVQQNALNMRRDMMKSLPEANALLKPKSKNVKIYYADTPEFNDYFNRHKKELGDYRRRTLLVINNTLPPDEDWLVTFRGMYMYHHPFGQAASSSLSSKSTLAAGLFSVSAGIPLATIKFVASALPKIVSELILYKDITLSEKNLLTLEDKTLGLHNLDIQPDVVWSIIQKLSSIYNEYNNYIPQENNRAQPTGLSARLKKVNLEELGV